MIRLSAGWFLDPCHVTPEGNRAKALAIADALLAAASDRL